ncbi:MAG TPA: hypothetical protein V6C64_08310, partial [Microcoleaceae cyanobacterium]
WRSFISSDIGIDQITGFNRWEGDKLVLGKETFTALQSVGGNGFSIASEFEIVGSDADAATSNAIIVYNSNNGNLFYNANGSAAGFYTPILDALVRGGQFATLAGAPMLAATDFTIEEPIIII